MGTTIKSVTELHLRDKMGMYEGPSEMDAIM
jgi:hypothetical protein